MLPWQPIKFSDLDKIHMNRRGLLKKLFCRKKFKISVVKQQKLPLYTFPIISKWKLQVAIATRVLIRLEQKITTTTTKQQQQQQQNKKTTTTKKTNKKTTTTTTKKKTKKKQKTKKKNNNKKQIFVPPPIDAICAIWKESASRLQRKSVKMLTDGRTTDDGCLPILQAHL